MLEQKKKSRCFTEEHGVLDVRKLAMVKLISDLFKRCLLFS